MVKWISRRSSEPLLGVRIPPRACGHSLVVGRGIANAEVGVRFSLAALFSLSLVRWSSPPEHAERQFGTGGGSPYPHSKTVDKPVDTVHKRH